MLAAFASAPARSSTVQSSGLPGPVHAQCRGVRDSQESSDASEPSCSTSRVASATLASATSADSCGRGMLELAPRPRALGVQQLADGCRGTGAENPLQIPVPAHMTDVRGRAQACRITARHVAAGWTSTVTPIAAVPRRSRRRRRLRGRGGSGGVPHGGMLRAVRPSPQLLYCSPGPLSWQIALLPAFGSFNSDSRDS